MCKDEKKFFGIDQGLCGVFKKAQDIWLGTCSTPTSLAVPTDRLLLFLKILAFLLTQTLQKEPNNAEILEKSKVRQLAQ